MKSMEFHLRLGNKSTCKGLVLYNTHIL